MSRIDLATLTLDELDNLTLEELDTLALEQIQGLIRDLYYGGIPPIAGQGGQTMAAYVVPQVQVFQELQLVPQADVRPLPAHIAGGHASLIRYAEADEKATGLLGQYDPLADDEGTGGHVYEWPDRPAGGTVDQSYTKVYIEDALLKYLELTTGDLTDTVETVASKTNQVRAAVTVFKANGTDYPRASALQERDVALGDIVKLRAVVDDTAYELCTYVSGFVAETVAAVTSAATADADNAGALGVGTSPTYDGDPPNCVAITAADATGYDGLADGNISETYTLTVVEGSVGGDLSTAQIRVVSASGNDPTTVISPVDDGFTDIGARGGRIAFGDSEDGSCSLSASDEGIAADDLVAGQVFVIQFLQDWTPPTATSSGTYTGDEDVVYIIEVTKGGLWADRPEITVTTDKGIDMSGPTVVTGSGVNVAVGTAGVRVQFNQAGLCKGDRYYISATASVEGNYQTLVLGHNLPDEVIDNGATAVDLTLYIRVPSLTVPAQQILRLEGGYMAKTNWTQADTQLLLMAGIYGYDSTWTIDGLPVALPVAADCEYSNVYVECRYWLADLCQTVTSISQVSELDASIPGVLHPDNPLKWGVYKALQNANGQNVAFTAVCDPSDPDAWLRVLELLDGRTDVYELVPLTRDEVVWGLYQAHVDDQSAPEIGRWRVAWFSAATITEKAIAHAATSKDGETIMAIIEDDPDAVGTQYTQLRVPARNGWFVHNHVAAGDIVRAMYTTDGFGSSSYTEYVVDAVVNEDTIRLVSGPAAAVSVARKIEIWRNLNATEEAAELAATSGYTDKRIRMVWPNVVGQDGYQVEGYFLCCCLAGLASGVVPQQGLTRLEIAGCDDVSQSTGRFTRSQLNALAAGGMWIVVQDETDGTIYTRHALTTADYTSIAEREEAVVRNLDSISYYFLDIYDPYIGVSNVTDSTIAMIRAETRGALKYLESAYYVQRLGGQIVSSNITEIRQHSTLLDRLVVTLQVTLPMPMNNIECHIQLVA